MQQPRGPAQVNGVSRRTLLSTLSLLPAVHLLGRQQGDSKPEFSSNVKVVNVFATVRDKQGKIVKNLTQNDFELIEDGRPQTIRYFARQSDLPLTLGLLVDTSGSERRMLGTERQASYKFLEQVLRPDRDKAFLIHFDHEVELLQDLTSSRQQLEKALDLLDKPEWGGGTAGTSSGGGQNGGGRGGWGGGPGGRGGYGRHGHGGGTALFDAIYLGSDDLLQKVPGRKAMVILTDGEDTGSKISLDEAIRTAQRADALGYSIRIADQEGASGFAPPGRMGGRHGGWGGGPGGGGPGGGRRSMEHVDGKKVLQQISRETGGAYFEVSKKKPVEEIYSEIEEELRNQYSLGYTSDRPDSETGYRKIQLTVKEKGLTVQSRDGYYVGPNATQS